VTVTMTTSNCKVNMAIETIKFIATAPGHGNLLGMQLLLLLCTWSPMGHFDSVENYGYLNVTR